MATKPPTRSWCVAKTNLHLHPFAPSKPTRNRFLFDLLYWFRPAGPGSVWKGLIGFNPHLLVRGRSSSKVHKNQPSIMTYRGERCLFKCPMVAEEIWVSKHQTYSDEHQNSWYSCMFNPSHVLGKTVGPSPWVCLVMGRTMVFAPETALL